MVLSSQYFPSIPWMQMCLQQQEVAIDQWENYQKQGLMNRCKILGAQGIITLSVPLVGGREQKSLLKDVKINNSSRWNIDQLRAIKSCYSKAPFFEYYFGPVENLLTKKNDFLLDLNMDALELLLKWFRFQPKPALTNAFVADRFKNVAEFKSVIKPVSYLQVFSDRRPFEPGLSVLDALFCMGPQAKELF